MLNKVDKCFLITIAVLIISLVLPILLIVILLNLNIECLFEIIFVCTVINYADYYFYNESNGKKQTQKRLVDDFI